MLRSTSLLALRLCQRVSLPVTEGSASRFVPQCHRLAVSAHTAQPTRNYTSSTTGKKDDSDKFTGEIPIQELTFLYSRSSGAGGQHVQKVNTKVELRFHLDSAKWIPDKIREKLKEQQRGRITKDGDLVVKSEKTRVQMMNKADALDKLREMIFKAGEEPPKPSEEDLKVKQEKVDKANEIRLQQKRMLSLKKQARGGPSIHDL